MSAFDAISHSGNFPDLAGRTQTEGYSAHSGVKTDLQPPEDEDGFRFGLARIIECYDDLVAVNVLISEPGSDESPSENLAIALGEALHAVTSTPSSLDSLLSLREKEALDVLHSIQLVFYLCMLKHFFMLIPTSFWTFHPSPIPFASVPLSLS
jgi:hypothetical protein